MDANLAGFIALGALIVGLFIWLLRHDIRELRADPRQEIGALRAETGALRTEMAELRGRVVRSRGTSGSRVHAPRPDAAAGAAPVRRPGGQVRSRPR